MFNDDKTFVENKYHIENESFDPYNRRAYHGYAFDEATGLDDEGISCGLNVLYDEIKNLPHPVAKAKAVRYVLDNTRIDVNGHDYFVGFWSVNNLAGNVTQRKWYQEVFGEKLPEISRKMKDMNASGAVSIWPDFDHVVPDWNAILNLGFPGLMKRAELYREKHRSENTLTPEKEAFFDAIIIEYGAIIDVIDRLYRYSLTKSDEKSEKITRCLKSIHDGAPENIYEAMQVIYIYFMVSECFDSY